MSQTRIDRARQENLEPKQTEKKPYARPQLIQHGNVEKLTQWRWFNNGPSGPA